MKIRKCIRTSQINVAEGGLVENVKISNFESHNYEEYKGEYKAFVPEGSGIPMHIITGTCLHMVCLHVKSRIWI